MKPRRRDVAVCCEWFARCVRPAAGTVAHPILGEVPTCRECAYHLDLDLKTTETAPSPPVTGSGRQGESQAHATTEIRHTLETAPEENR